MSYQASNWACEQRVGNPVLKLLLMTLANYAGPKGEASWYSQTQMSYDTEIPERSLRRHLQKLVEMGLIETEARKTPAGTKTTSLIRVMMYPPAKLASGLSTGQNEGEPPAKTGGQPPANMMAGQEQPSNNQEQTDRGGETSKVTKAKSRQVPIPEDLAISSENLRFARERGFEADQARFMFDKFKSHHQAKGSLMVKWDAAWRTWVLNQVGFQKKDGWRSNGDRGSPII